MLSYLTPDSYSDSRMIFEKLEVKREYRSLLFSFAIFLFFLKDTNLRTKYLQRGTNLLMQTMTQARALALSSMM